MTTLGGRGDTKVAGTCAGANDALPLAGVDIEAEADLFDCA
jgi:hypothetical protein